MRAVYPYYIKSEKETTQKLLGAVLRRPIVRTRTSTTPVWTGCDWLGRASEADCAGEMPTTTKGRWDMLGWRNKRERELVAFLFVLTAKSSKKTVKS